MIRIALAFPNGDMVVFQDVAVSDQPVSAQVHKFKTWATRQPGVLRVASEGFRVRVEMKENPS